MTYAFVTVLCLAAPHILYACIWYQPQIWRAQFKKDSVDIFASVATALKVLQFTAVLAWLILNSKQYAFFSLTEVPVLLWLPCIALVGIGQVLNISIYRAIGKKGVYYGFKLGSPVPWHTGFPFNVVSHPQYVGSIFTIWGAGGLVWTQAPHGWTALLIYWTVLYVLTGLQEQYS